jgi:hypothetical protein
MKVFWSWQSDTPGKTGRHFIRGALDAAVEELKRDLALVEPSEREAVDAMHVDQDRQGVAGSTDLFPEILKKIAASDIVVADVTSIGIIDPEVKKAKKGEKPKRLINSNVAIELGYSYHVRTNSFVLLVMNNHYGKHEDLPFDLRHKGGTVAFTLAPDAVKAEIERIGKMLTRRFVDEIRLCLSAKAVEQETAKSLPSPQAFNSAPIGAAPALYFKRGEILATAGLPGEQAFTFKEDRAAYLRLFPAHSVDSPGMARVVREFNMGRAMPMSERADGINGRNKYGGITFDSQGRDTLTAFTQSFATGELWGINGYVLRPHNINGVEHTIVPIIAFEKMFVKALTNYVAIATQAFHFSPPFTVIMGVWGLVDAYLTAPGGQLGAGQQIGPIYESEYQKTETLSATDEASIKGVLRSFFMSFYDLAATPRDQILTNKLVAAHDLPAR